MWYACLLVVQPGACANESVQGTRSHPHTAPVGPSNTQVAEAPTPTWAELGWKSESQRKEVREHEAENRLYDRSEGIVFVPALVVESHEEEAKETHAKKAESGSDGEGNQDEVEGKGKSKGGEEEDEDEGLIASILSMRCYIRDSKTSRINSFLIAHEGCGIVCLMCFLFYRNTGCS